MVCLPALSPDYPAASISLKGVAMENSCDGSLMWRVRAGETDLPLWSAAEEWGGLALLNVCARTCVCVCLIVFSLPRPLSPSCSTFFFLRSCLDSYSLFHANILERSSSLLVCTPYCVFGLAPCTFSLCKIKPIKKRRALEGKKPPQHHWNGAMEVWGKLRKFFFCIPCCSQKTH